MAMAQGKQASQTGSSSCCGQSSTTSAASEQELLQILTECHTRIQGEQRSEIESSNNQSTSAVDHGEEMSAVIPKGASIPPALPLWLAEIISAKKDEQPKNNYDLDHKIQRVPPTLREIESSKYCYEPCMISLGPFHHGKPEFQQMEEIKISMMQRFIEGTGRSAQVVYSKFLEVARSAKREYYVLEPEENSIDDDRFLRILFVDLCFLIQFIHAGMDWHEYGLTNVGSRGIAFVQRDLFLLENQLPFPVLKALMMLRFSKDDFFEIIRRFISDIIAIRLKRASWYLSDVSAYSEQPVHLLHALQMELTSPEKRSPRSEPDWITELTSPEKRSPRSEPDWITYSYRSAMELKAAGVYFKSWMTRSGRLTDIRFNSFSGSLSLRPLVIDHLSKAMFLNSCTFELFIAPENRKVTSYLCFMHSLIQSGEDVKELRSRGVLINGLGSDQEVVDMFTGIPDRLGPESEAYTGVLEAIERQCNSHVRTWIAQFRQQHCSSPLTILGFVLAAFAIALSVIQTYYQVYPRGTK